MRTEIQKVAWRSYWPVTLLAVTFLLVVTIFGGYLNGRQQVANARAEKQRKAICAILANIPGHIPTEIAAARIVFARPGHPDDCRVVVHPTVKRTPSPTAAPTPTVTLVPSSQETFIIVRPARTTSPQPSPRPSRTQPPRPTPSPSVCIAGVCLPSPSLLESHDRHRGGGTDDTSPAPSPSATST